MGRGATAVCKFRHLFYSISGIKPRNPFNFGAFILSFTFETFLRLYCACYLVVHLF